MGAHVSLGRQIREHTCPHARHTTLVCAMQIQCVCLIVLISGDATRVDTCEYILRVSHMYSTRVCASSEYRVYHSDSRTKTGIFCLFSVQKTGIFQISGIRLHMSIMWG